MASQKSRTHSRFGAIPCLLRRQKLSERFGESIYDEFNPEFQAVPIGRLPGEHRSRTCRPISVALLLSAAAKAFFPKALKHHREPHCTTLDGHRPALRRMGMNGEFNFRGRNPVRIRCCPYLNNVVEQNHRRVEGRLRPMLGFKTLDNAQRVIIGIELEKKIHKRQFAIPSTLQSNPAVIWRHVMAA